ncbi:Serine/threonine-protein kinase KIC1 [Rhypophila sp. PSN 637]
MAEPEGYYEGAADTPQPPCFILMPLNSPARTATGHVRNRYRQYQDTNTFGLWIDFSDPAQQSYTLGRGEGVDIYLPESVGRGGNAQISSIHASFKLVPITGAVLLCDNSKHHNTEPFSSSHGTSFTIKFQRNTTSVLVAPGINTRIAFGKDRYYQFELQWRSAGLYDFPRSDEEPFFMGPRNSRAKKYLQGTKVGGGAYGNVWQVLDVTRGTVMAVKKFHNLSGKNLEFATREVANLFKINKDRSIQHQHILQIYDYAGGGSDDNWGEIFMPLMRGNLKTLVEKTPGIDDWAVANTVLEQMLLALQCISSHKIVHRDIKPENILWDYDVNNNYHFCLGDFGLSNDPKLAITVAGTEPFMAPEVYHRKPQTTKVDIWSLFATVVWVRNTQSFRGMCGQLGAPQIHDWLVTIARSESGYENIRTMAQKDPRKRPSASTQLGILNGNFAEPASYPDVVSGDEAAEELGNQFGSMNLEEDAANYYPENYGAGAGGASTSPEMAYYEPYTSHLREQFPWEDQAGPSKQYIPPPEAPRVRQEHEAFQAAAYGEVQYGGYDPGQGAAGGGGGDSGEGTTVPDMWTQVPLQPEEEQQPAYRESSRRKQKGKHKY